MSSLSRDFLLRQTKIAPTSNEWAQLEYSLQLSIGSTAPVVKQIWSVASAHQAINFDKRTQGVLVLDSWIDTSSLDENNRLEDVCSKGFKCPPGGVYFRIGNVQLANGPLAYNKTYEFLLVKVGIGKSYSINAATVESDSLQVPRGYDSIYLYNPSSEESSYNHNYGIFDPSQLLALFVVHFELDPNLEEGLNAPICDICQEAQAVVYCEADEASLCLDCDDDHHNRGNRLMQKHKRINISEKPKRFGNCPYHPDTKVEFFCTVCHVPVCVNCKMVGNHSTPETSTHTFAKIGDAYLRALNESTQPDPVLEQRKLILNQLLESIDKRMGEVKSNAEQIEAKIYKILQDALLQLQEHTQGKVSALLCAELEIKRQLEQIAWIECFLKYQQEVLSPAQFMLSWGRHLNLRNDIFTSNEVSELNVILPDIKIEGNINVTTEAAIRKYGQQSDVQSVASSTPKTSTSKFRSQIFNRYQGNNAYEKTPSSVLKQIIPSKPTEALAMKFSSVLNMDSGRRSPRSDYSQ
ncbi:unnamed protein product [Blepharisma stoltei]|uniref:B box-type domain-containing protein n=1 Tax=Blepharisma stoltei TaxID=1481888 RepID=A0AAU9JN16_9CILI|nr:unnamed protein product [Blepharisma stoltei]